MNKQKKKTVLWRRRQRRIRGKVQGTPEQPRLCVFRSGRNMYAQLIDDSTGSTLVSASTLSKEMSFEGKCKSNKAAAAKVGEAIAKKAIDVGVHKVCLDRSGYKYHGRVKALADAARKGGLVF
ncbi:MAG: 50S ribosomal protein L18 [Sedimentisphaerales bacterium]|nr:50S ribosomal protein L18 [Sedimentisphaerales bacterium]